MPKEKISINCSESIYGASAWRPTQCSRKGRFEHGGKYYCKQHWPVEVKRKNEERRAKWDEESRVRDAKSDLNMMKNSAYDVLKLIHEGYNNPKELCDTFFTKLAELEAEVYPD